MAPLAIGRCFRSVDSSSEGRHLLHLCLTTIIGTDHELDLQLHGEPSLWGMPLEEPILLQGALSPQLFDALQHELLQVLAISL